MGDEEFMKQHTVLRYHGELKGFPKDYIRSGIEKLWGKKFTVANYQADYPHVFMQRSRVTIT